MAEISNGEVPFLTLHFTCVSGYVHTLADLTPGQRP